ncbi:hypothetical protein DL771_000719 [Monosporascus sp. 5C6A]|nr:hypothetical protein DL771_000719 [Monosporascus sp. 5C6A]
MARAMGALILDKHDETLLIVARMIAAPLLYKAVQNERFLPQVKEAAEDALRGTAQDTGTPESGGKYDQRVLSRCSLPPRKHAVAATWNRCRSHKAGSRAPGPGTGIRESAEDFAVGSIDKRLETYRGESGRDSASLRGQLYQRAALENLAGSEDVGATKNVLEGVAPSFRMKLERLTEETMDYLEVRG